MIFHLLSLILQRINKYRRRGKRNGTETNIEPQRKKMVMSRQSLLHLQAIGSNLGLKPKLLPILRSEHHYIRNMLSKSRFNRSKNDANRHCSWVNHLCRKRIETVFSQITQLFPKSIRAVTKRGFVLKILLFIVAYIFMILWKDRALSKTC